MPTAEQIEKAKRDALLARGVIINHYATIEYCLDELLFRLRRCEEYAPAFTKARIPNEVSEKIDLADEVLARPGRLFAYADDIIAALDALQEYTLIRHLAAHGMMTIQVTDEGATMTLEKFSQEKTQLGQHRIVMDAGAVAFTTARLSLYARTALNLIRNASAAADLPRLDEP